MQIGEFSRQTDLTIDTLRYYEEVGLLRPTRTAGNHRQYQAKDIDCLPFAFKTNGHVDSKHATLRAIALYR